jgi:hypothetical protein
VLTLVGARRISREVLTDLDLSTADDLSAPEVSSEPSLSNLALLSGGYNDYISSVLKDGIATSGKEKEMKLGPGLYFTAYIDNDGNWTRGDDGKSWHQHVWRANVSMQQSVSNLPYVLTARLRGRPSFGILPRNFFYGKWKGANAPSQKKGCLTAFDALLIPPTYSNPISASGDAMCSDMYNYMQNRDSEECLSVRQEDVLHLAAVGCIQELKLNPGREKNVRLETLSVHAPVAKLAHSDTLTLSGARPGSVDATTMFATSQWLCKRETRRRAWQLKLKNLNMSALPLYEGGVLEACGEALSAWGQGQRRPRCGKACDTVHQFLIAEADSLYYHLDESDSRRKALKDKWMMHKLSNSARSEYRRLRAELMRTFVCQAHESTFAGAVKEAKCAPALHTSLEKVVCKADAVWDTATATAICSWL